MDEDFGNTPIDCYLPQFSQREASDLSGVSMPTLNNWLQRGDYKLAESEDRRLVGRRFFSIADTAALHTRDFCTKHLDMRPASASIAGGVVYNAFCDYRRVGEVRDDGQVFEFWHIMHKSPFPSISAIDGWNIQGIWQDRTTGAFHHYDPIRFPEEEPFGFPHFPCLSIPTSEIVRRIFLRCADFLQSENAENPDAD